MSNLDKKAIEENLKNIKHKIVVLSNKGGVGKSTFSAMLASYLAGKGHSVGLLDADIHGPSQGILFNISDQPLMGDEFGRIQPIEFNDNLKVISVSNMTKNADDALIWRGPMKTSILTQFLKDVEWGTLDYLIIDAPPGTGDELMTISGIVQDLKALIITTPQKMAMIDTRKAINFLDKMNVPIIGLIENMAIGICPECGKEINLFRMDSSKKDNKHPKYQIPFIRSLFMAAEEGTLYHSVQKNKDISKYLEDIVLE